MHSRFNVYPVFVCTYLCIFIIIDGLCDPDLQCRPCVKSPCDFYANPDGSVCIPVGTVPRGTFDKFVGSPFVDGCPTDPTRRPGPNPPASPTMDPMESTTETTSVPTSSTLGPQKLGEGPNPWLYLLTVAGKYFKLNMIVSLSNLILLYPSPVKLKMNYFIYIF